MPLSFYIFNATFGTPAFQGLSNRAARSIGRGHLYKALDRHRGRIMRSNTRHIVLVYMLDRGHNWSTIRGYNAAGRLCITIHLQPDTLKDEVWSSSQTLRDMWQTREELNPGSQRAAVIFRRDACTMGFNVDD
ncbi:hypothetical protein HGRIS_000703 [Hohenbuehelia grisea]|uniref:Uncharacterized protein n=1 Tax=Hohenbuehelia grisea TaxID=104357 RepID=A0ABR3JRS8_9AGAR